MAEDNDSSTNTNLKSKKSINGTTEGASTSTSINTELIKNDSIIFKCEHCDKFETTSHSIFLVHVVSCTALLLKNRNDDNEDTISNGPMNSMKQENGKTTDSTSKKLFECDVCNMKFSNGANMRRHKMRHTGVKPYECRVCQKRFFRKDHLAEHFTTHTKTLPYHCPICNRGFQRQIAMRAHFQNEHVGQHDLVKTCPLCNFRAGTMKSLRVHFFNRHGIDLDNPGSNTPSSLLAALNPKNTSQFTTTSSALATIASIKPSYSDSGESLRSNDNATPPMHFLTPHVEISMAADNEPYNSDIPVSGSSKTTLSASSHIAAALIHSTQSESNIASNSQSSFSTNQRNNPIQEDSMTPSISLIPIKQEPEQIDEYMETKSNDQNIIQNTPSTSTASMNPLNSIIKVSPLKSLLREDLKRRICARATTRANRNNSNNNNVMILPSDTSIHTEQQQPIMSSSSSSSTNGINANSCQELDLSINRTVQLKCLFCRIEFPDQTLYFLHKGCHSGEINPWKCNICGEQCNNVYEFNSHLLSKSHQ